MSSVKINWEEEDSPFEGITENMEHSEDFAAMLAGEKITKQERLRVGDEVTARVIRISPNSDDVALELGSKGTGTIAKQDLIVDGVLPKEGDLIDAFVISVDGGEFILGKRLSPKMAQADALEQAFNNQMPVRARVTGVNKGGFELSVMNRQGFCPMGQLDVVRIEKPEEYIGQEFEFLIQRYSRRDLVLSRSALLGRLLKERLSTLKVGDILEGQVRSIRDFGAMVDIGGPVGMVHISELGYGHFDSVADAVSVGQKLKVKLLGIEERAGQQPRIALSAKQAQEDPWSEVGSWLHVGDSVEGTVVRLLKVGAIVELRPGIDGMIHVSEMSWVKRVNDPADVLKVGERVSVRIQDIKHAERRISLSMKDIAADPWQGAAERFPVNSVWKVSPTALKPFGALAELEPGVTVMIPQAALNQAYGAAFRRKASPGNTLEVRIHSVDIERKRMMALPVEVTGEDAVRQDFAEYEASLQEKSTQTAKSSGSFGDLLAASMAKKS